MPSPRVTSSRSRLAVSRTFAWPIVYASGLVQREIVSRDVVSCRNVLIYLQRPLQARTMAHLRGALSREGVLVLGEAEWPTPDIEASLEVIARQARVFKAKPVSRGQGACR